MKGNQKALIFDWDHNLSENDGGKVQLVNSIIERVWRTIWYFKTFKYLKYFSGSIRFSIRLWRKSFEMSKPDAFFSFQFNFSFALIACCNKSHAKTLSRFSHNCSKNPTKAETICTKNVKNNSQKNIVIILLSIQIFCLQKHFWLNHSWKHNQFWISHNNRYANIYEAI